MNKTEQALRAALIRLMGSDDGIAAATDDDLRSAIDDSTVDPIVREQAASVLQARAALSQSEAPAEQPEDEREYQQETFEAWREEFIRKRGFPPHPIEVWQAAKRDALTQAPQEPLKWKFTGIAGLKQYLTDSQYQAQTDGVKKWYEPICETCQKIAPQERAAVTDAQIQELWGTACMEDSPSKPGCERHLRFARALLSLAQSSEQKEQK